MSNNQAGEPVTSAFIRGQRDCKNGKAHKSGQSSSYDRGYAVQYELEAVKGSRGFN